MKWNLIRINDLVESDEASLQTGPFGTQLKASEYAKEGIPVINVRNIGYGSVTDEKLEYVNNTTAERLRVHRLRENDIVFGRKGAVDRHALIDKKSDGWIQGSDCLRLRIRAKNIQNKFVSYYFCTKAHKEWMEAQGSFGATMNSLNQDIIKRISIPLPPLKVQHQIAAVLSAYDELIENNKRRITILEKMAEEFYREWFIRFRFPGHEKVKIVKGVPEFWEFKKIGDVVRSKYGYTESAVIDNSLPKYLRVMDINKNSYIEWYSVPNCPIDPDLMNSYRLLQNDIVIARMASPGKVAIIEQEVNAVFASYLIKLIPDKKFIMPYYLFYTLSNDYYQGIFINADSSATRGSINGKTINNFPIIIPPMDIQLEFCEIIEPLRSAITCYLKTNNNLRATRDLMMVRFLSEKDSIDDLDICFPKSMEDDYAELHQ